MILIAGGDQDPNITRLAAAAAARGIRFVVAASGVDRLYYRLGGRGLWLNGYLVNPEALFARFNVFGYDPHTDITKWWLHHDWHTVLVDSLPESKTLNGSSVHASKMQRLQLAADAGFDMPETAINDRSPFDGICKPIHGGAHTQMIKSGEAVPWSLGYCQEYLPGPEYRIYVVGDKVWKFKVESPSVDYRQHQDAVISTASGLELEVECMRRLMASLGLRFAAVDLRADAKGNIKFLEINDGPMFAAFDELCDGQIAEAILEELAA